MSLAWRFVGWEENKGASEGPALVGVFRDHQGHEYRGGKNELTDSSNYEPTDKPKADSRAVSYALKQYPEPDYRLFYSATEQWREEQLICKGGVFDSKNKGHGVLPGCAVAVNDDGELVVYTSAISVEDFAYGIAFTPFDAMLVANVSELRCVMTSEGVFDPVYKARYDVGITRSGQLNCD